MSYFKDNYSKIRLPIGEAGSVGLRRCQLGAIRAIASHFTIHKKPAIVAMPTGSGKTAVLLISTFFLRAKRVLVVTPSRLVRNQIAEEFRTLKILKDCNVIEGEIAYPEVIEVIKRITSLSMWQSFDSYDVVVGSPNSVSPSITDIPSPPPDLFDLILVDEAHHSPAATWNELLNSFPGSMRILVTATPFRQDRKEIQGDLIYCYPIKSAIDDGIFGRIEYKPVSPSPGQSSDITIAKEAERLFKQDRADGFNHFLMVRTDQRKRANELAVIYRNNTSLNLQKIHSQHSYNHIKKIIKDLKDHKIDGIICVDMIGEGFDFPNLKLAAIHSPHRSLAITLQFIGRFARTGARDVDSAKFVAVPSEIEIQAKKIYSEDAEWQIIVPGMLQERLETEVKIREKLNTFAIRRASDEPEEISLYALRPFFHVKVFSINGTFNRDAQINLEEPYHVVYHYVSEDLNSVVLITKEILKPKWMILPHFEKVEYDLFIIYFDLTSHLLFICASRKTLKIYHEIAEQLVDSPPKILPLSTVNKALKDIQDIEFFNIGMRNRVHSSNTESYRTITGKCADKAIRKSDSRLYDRGHCFGRGFEGSDSQTIGIASSSKIWSMKRSQIPEFVDWCQKLARKLNSLGDICTKSGLDYLSVGIVTNAIPENIIAVAWDPDIYNNPKRVIYRRTDGEIDHYDLLDLDLVMDIDKTTPDSIGLFVQGPNLRWPFMFFLSGDPFYRLDSEASGRLFIEKTFSTVDFLDYVNEKPPHFFTSDFSRFVRNELFQRSATSDEFPQKQITVIDWASNKVDIMTESEEPPNKDLVSIHKFLENYLASQRHNIIVYDHGTGEIADFITVDEDADGIGFSLYHCKASGKKNPGERVEDFYEVCGQVVKSMIWLNDNDGLARKLRHRTEDLEKCSRFIAGDLAEFNRIVDESKMKQSKYGINLVQPGISRSKLSPKGTQILSAANDYVIAGHCSELIIFASD